MASSTVFLRRASPSTFVSQKFWAAPNVCRQFSASAARHVTGSTFPDFNESSSPELGRLLADIRQKNLLPGYLSADQYRLITKPQYRNSLSQDPVKIEINGVDVTLEPINILTDMPRRAQVLKQVLGLIKEEEDFENMEKLLAAFEGMRGGDVRHAKLKQGHRCAVIARLGHLNQISTVLKVLRDPNRYGVRLKDPKVLQITLLGILTHTCRQDWDEQSTRSALSFAEQLVDLLERKEHGGDKALDSEDPRRLPQVVALPLEMAATLVKNKQASPLEIQKARDYAERLMGVLDQTTALESAMVEAKTWKEIIPCLIVQDALSKALEVADEISLPNQDLARTVEERLRSAIIKMAKFARDESTLCRKKQFSETTLGISLASCGLEI